MIGALITTFSFALTAVFANRAAQMLGSVRANMWRLVVATAVLGGWAHLAGRGFGGPALWWFFAGGLAGFGVGGLAMFQSLPRLGSSLAMLIVQCGSAVFAAALEWGWLGTRLSGMQIACATITLLGVCVGLMPRSLPKILPAEWGVGLAWALLSAAGQGAGAVLSRKGFAMTRALHENIDPGSAAYQRAVAGLLFAAVVYLIIRKRGEKTSRPSDGAWPWVLANALTGPILGVVCYQWALSSTPAGIVQPIVAASPLVTIPFAAQLENTWPRPLYYTGALLAVLGVTGLLLWR
jgi:drug/metabolite transporter (DMT)-like permease